MYDPADPDPDYELAWPRELFRSEARLLSRRLQPGHAAEEAIVLLLEEAFAGRSPVDDLREALRDPSQRLLRNQPTVFLDALVVHLDALPERPAPRPYWAIRHGNGPHASPEQPGRRRVQHDWTDVVEGLRVRGYLDRLAPRGCVDAPEPDQDSMLDRETRDRLGVGGLWPLQSGEWDEDTFYSLIELVHDLVARPRHRRWHEFSGCGWHYSRFAAGPGRALYRWHVDRILARHDIPLRMADSGEDIGRLVHVAGEGRDQLVARVTTVEVERGTREHAVALFRGRGAGVPEKRSAILALLGLLEARRDLVKTELLSKDEGALFSIANQFALRHQRADQRADYDEAYLDWLYWWYLATLDLTDRLLARQADGAAAGAS